MKKIIILLLFVSLLGVKPVAGQELCGTDVSQFINQKMTNNSSVGFEIKDSLVLPLMFHVIHSGEPLGQGSNVNDTFITNMIVYLNKSFKNDIFGTDTKIRFALAQRGPDGLVTSGIRRVNAQHELEDYMAQQNVYRVEPIVEKANGLDWDKLQYINIYVVPNMPNWVAGFAWLGNYCFINYQKSSVRSGRTIIHELGHYLGLNHTFDGSVFQNNQWTCTENSDCSVQGDKICDTPPHLASDQEYLSSCYGGPHPEYGTHNFMSYGLTRELFTGDQIDRMYSYLDNYCVNLIENAPWVLGQNVTTVTDIKGDNIFNLYPNPTRNHIFLKMNPATENGTEATIIIYNSIGAVVWNQTTADANINIDVTDWQKSVYIVSISKKNNYFFKKIIVQ